MQVLLAQEYLTTGARILNPLYLDGMGLSQSFGVKKGLWGRIFRIIAHLSNSQAIQIFQIHISSKFRTIGSGFRVQVQARLNMEAREEAGVTTIVVLAKVDRSSGGFLFFLGDGTKFR